MEPNNVNPSEIKSFHITGQRTNVIDLNKKRKLEAELLGLPIAKHKCWNGSLPLKSLSILEKNPKVEDFDTTIIKGTAEDDGSENESAKDSNNVVEDSDSAMSEHGESKFEAGDAKTWSYHHTSSSLSNWSSSSFKDNSCTSDSITASEGGDSKEQFAFVGEENHPSHHVDGLLIAETFDDPLIGDGNNVHELCPGYGNVTEEQYTEKDIDTLLYSNEVNPNVYVLSSGRWSVNQDSQIGKRKPTIDQEFEQYFSTLML
ncbi:hypothetical protein ACOSQ3_029986 [Xanthoceras sorbifolium]